jgi:hypothetical protein
MPFMPEGPLRAAGAHDPTDRAAASIRTRSGEAAGTYRKDRLVLSMPLLISSIQAATACSRVRSLGAKSGRPLDSSARGIDDPSPPARLYLFNVVINHPMLHGLERINLVTVFNMKVANPETQLPCFGSGTGRRFDDYISANFAEHPCLQDIRERPNDRQNHDRTEVASAIGSRQKRG